MPNMENDKNLQKGLDTFLDKPVKQKETESEKVVATRTGLVERIDKTLLVEDGRVLLND